MEVRSAIQQIALEHRRRYGYRRITAEAHRRGRQINHKRVARIMREDNMPDYNTSEKDPSAVGQVSGGIGTASFILAASPSESSAVCNVYFSDYNVGGYANEAARGQSYYVEDSRLHLRSESPLAAAG